jgi:hypothetical protein
MCYITRTLCFVMSDMVHVYDIVNVVNIVDDNIVNILVSILSCQCYLVDVVNIVNCFCYDQQCRCYFTMSTVPWLCVSLRPCCHAVCPLLQSLPTLCTPPSPLSCPCVPPLSPFPPSAHVILSCMSTLCICMREYVRPRIHGLPARVQANPI